MSHISRIKTQIVEKTLLLKALQDLEYPVADEGETVKVLIRFSYPIHFERRGQTYEIVADWWGVRGVKRKEFADAVAQRYAYHATRAKLEQQGFTLVEEQTGEKGQIRMVLRRMV